MLTLKRTLVLSLGIVLFSFCSNAQEKEERKFHFGASAGLTASQVDGDALTGFHKIGYQVGLIGGYSFSKAHGFILKLEYGTFGSKRKNEDVEKNLETDLTSINVLLAYSLRFGDSWDGIRKFQFIVGPKLQRIIKMEGEQVSTESLKNQFVAAHAGFSYVVSKAFLVDLTYTHSLTNLLEEPLMTTDTFVPYYLTIGLSYYLYK